jgi:hypothetical protein
MPAVTEPSERPLEAWETSAGGPYVTIRTGGPLDGLVTITATGSEGRVTIQATRGLRHSCVSIVAERVGHAAADKLAQAWANELAVGREPQPD